MLSQNSWGILLHPLLLDQLERVIAAAEAERSRRDDDSPAGANMKVAASLRQLMFAEIPQDPSRSSYRQGNTLGTECGTGCVPSSATAAFASSFATTATHA